jgi:hypothetical protein
MVGASAHGRTDVNYYYVCTRQQHEGGKYSCQASRIPAEALESAIIGRIRDIGRMVEARDRIVQEALACLGGEAARLRDEEEVTRRRVAQVRADMGRLVDVLKSLGARGLASVQAELERLEAEEDQLKRSLADLANRQAPVERVSDDARSFLESWQDIGELLEAATPEERLQLLQHYIEVVELGPIDPETRTGSYAMRLFPEVRPDRGFDFSDESGPDDSTPGPETTNGAAHVKGNGSAVVNPGRFGSHNRPESSPTRTRTWNKPVNSRMGFPARSGRNLKSDINLGKDLASGKCKRPLAKTSEKPRNSELPGGSIRKNSEERWPPPAAHRAGRSTIPRVRSSAPKTRTSLSSVAHVGPRPVRSSAVRALAETPARFPSCRWVRPTATRKALRRSPNRVTRRLSRQPRQDTGPLLRRARVPRATSRSQWQQRIRP